MFIPMAVGVIITTILLSFSFLSIDLNSWTKHIINKENLTGKVLGATEVIDRGLPEFNTEVKKLLTGSPQVIQTTEVENKSAQNLKVSDNELKPIDFNLAASSGVALDCQTDNLIFTKQADRPWPLASITKLVTALVFLDFNPGWEKIYQIKESDRRDGGKIYLFSGEKVKVKDLFYFSLVGSDNTATIALVHSSGLSEVEFVKKMNDKILELKLSKTKFIDPVGLSDDNISTAREIAIISKIALATVEISRACLMKKYEFTTLAGRKKIIYNTNELLDKFPQDGISLVGGKTGHVAAAGYCLAAKFKSENGREIITVVLGADSDQARFSLTEKLANIILANFK